MKNCLIVINKISGNYKAIDEQKLAKIFAKDDAVKFAYIENEKFNWDLKGIDKLIVCGGDGTLNNAINACKNKPINLIYCPYGTFNEMSKNAKQKIATLINSGKINERYFSYVAATGTFTPLGYIVPYQKKQQLKIFAYFLKVLSQYKVHAINADIKTDKYNFNDKYTLIMLINSERCFGLKFNYLYKLNDNVLHLLLIKSPGKNNLINKIKIFFPFFRAFFIGFKKPMKTKNMVFIPVKFADINLDNPETFCVDGEKYLSKKQNHVKSIPLTTNITIVSKSILKKLLK